MLGGWLTRPNESKRTCDQIILFAKYTLHPGKRATFQKALLDGLPAIDKEEPGTLSILLIEDDSNENVTYVLERFKDQAAFEAHMHGSGAAKVMPIVEDCMKTREGGVFKEVAGFLSKDE
jgi:quinol monooxygenase YgiN